MLYNYNEMCIYLSIYNFGDKLSEYSQSLNDYKKSYNEDKDYIKCVCIYKMYYNVGWDFEEFFFWSTLLLK